MEISDFKTRNYKCEKCNWEGTGEQAEFGGEVSGFGFILNCPNCKETVRFIVFPKLEDVIEHGNEAEKDSAINQLNWKLKIESNELIDISQLPDCHNTTMTVILREEEKDGRDYIVLYSEGKEIWREYRYYEYGKRFAKIGEILLEKYGTQLMDFVPEEYSVYLLGDRLIMLDYIADIRQKIRSNYKISYY